MLSELLRVHALATISDLTPSCNTIDLDTQTLDLGAVLALLS